MSTHLEIKKMLNDSLASLAPQQYKAAKYLLNNTDDIALISMRALAKNAGVKATTITRLCKNLGFEKYEYFRKPFEDNLRKPTATYSTQLKEIQQRGVDNPLGLYQEARTQDLNNIKSTVSDENFSIIFDASDTIRKSRRVYVLGLRSSYAAAFSFHYAYQLFRDNSQLVDTKAGMFTDQLRGINNKDCMLAISSAPYTKMTTDAVEYATKSGVKIIAVTDKHSSPIARVAEHTIITRKDSPSFYQSLTGALAVNNALITLLVARTGGDAMKIVKETEKQLSEISAYW